MNLWKKSLKIPKGQSESVSRRTDNTMAKRRGTKGQTTINKTKDRVTRTPLKTGSELRSPEGYFSIFERESIYTVNHV